MAWFTSSRAPSDVITIGTLYLTHIRRSSKKPPVGFMDDQMDGIRRGTPRGIFSVIPGQFSFDALQPLFQHLRGTRIQRRKAAHDTRLALGDDQIGGGNDKHGRADDRQRQTSGEYG